MEIAGSSYLFTVALAAITYVGFTALVAILRQVAGAHMGPLDIFLTRTFIQLGFMATGGALLPPLLALSELPHATVWSISSGASAIVLGCWVVTFPKRRLTASKIPVPARIWCLIGLLAAGVAALALNAVKPVESLRVILYAAPISAILFVGAMMFISALYFLVSKVSVETAPNPSP